MKAEEELKKEIERISEDFLEFRRNHNDFMQNCEKCINFRIVLNRKLGELEGFLAGQLAERERCLKMKIIKDEFCQCGHSKKAHLPHQLDKNGGRCAICFKCDCYTWKGFEFVSEEELTQKIKEGEGK